MTIRLSSSEFLSSSVTKIRSIAPSNARITITTRILTKLAMNITAVNLARDPTAMVAITATATVVNLARDPIALASITSAIPPITMKLTILVIGKAAICAT